MILFLNSVSFDDVSGTSKSSQSMLGPFSALSVLFMLLRICGGSVGVDFEVDAMDCGVVDMVVVVDMVSFALVTFPID